MPSQEARRAVHSSGVATLAALATLILLVTLGAGSAITRDLGTQRDIRTAVDGVDTLLTLQLDEETGLRGFSATGDTVYLEPFNRASEAMPFAFDSLRTTLRRLSVEAPTVTTARQHNARWRGTVADPIVDRRVPLRDVRTAREGKRLVDAFRGDIARLHDELNVAARDADTRASRTLAFVAASALVLSVTLVALIVAGERARLRRERVSAEERAIRFTADDLPQPLWTLDDRGEIRWANRAWRAVTGITPSGATRYDYGIVDSDAQALHATFSAAEAAARPIEREVRYGTAQGERWFLLRLSPQAASSGSIVRWIATATDVDEHRRAGEALAAAFEREQRASLAFQEAALPRALPNIPGLRFDAIYAAANAESQVGGDWYDAFRLTDGRIVVSVGDVAGSGLDAAVTMSGVRQAIRGAAQIFPDPAAVLDAAERTLRSDRPDDIVTAFVGIIDPVTLAFTYATAGHPMPLVRGAAGNVERLSGGGLPLGLRGVYDPEKAISESIELSEPCLLVFYTDGLIESRHDVVEGEAQLIRAVADPSFGTSGNAAQELRSSLLETMSDDIAVLVLRIDDVSHALVRIAATAERERFEFRASDASASRDARAHLAGILRDHGAAESDITTAELVYSELIGNVMRHADDRAEVIIDLGAASPVLHVLDRGRGFFYSPTLPSDLMAESGRGLFITTAMTSTFTVFPRAGGGSHARAVFAFALVPGVQQKA